MLKNNKNDIYIGYNEFIKMVSNNSDYTQVAIRGILDAVDRTITDELSKANQDRSVTIKVTNCILADSRYIGSTRKILPSGQEIMTKPRIKTNARLNPKITKKINNYEE